MAHYWFLTRINGWPNGGSPNNHKFTLAFGFAMGYNPPRFAYQKGDACLIFDFGGRHLAPTIGLKRIG